MTTEKTYPKGTTKEQIERNVFYSPDGCWYWLGDINSSGYGRIKLNDERKFVHRISYCVNKGEIPAGLLVCHSCDNKLCANPDHLFLGTHSINALDMHIKGKSNKAIGEKIHLAKLTDSKVIEIRNMFQSGISKTNIAKNFNVHPNTIHSVIKKITWKHL